MAASKWLFLVAKFFLKHPFTKWRQGNPATSLNLLKERGLAIAEPPGFSTMARSRAEHSSRSHLYNEIARGIPRLLVVAFGALLRREFPNSAAMP